MTPALEVEYTDDHAKCVHTEHCCAEHGCKYFDDDCPVVTGRKKQSYPCEACSDEPTSREVELENLLHRVMNKREFEYLPLNLRLDIRDMLKLGE